MRSFNCLIFSLLFFINIKGQQNHFLYIQAENKQAFYVKLSDKLFSSAASGYTIIPKLRDSVYKLTIGFPKNEWPSQMFDITINAKDEGFLLKNFGDKGWGLFNLQTFKIVMGTGAAVVMTPAVETKSDAFSNALAEVTNTPSIRQVDPVKETTAADTIKTLVVQEEIKKSEAAIGLPVPPIKQVFSDIDLTGRSMVYTIAGADHIDRITIFIPYENKEALKTIKDAEAAVKAAADSAVKMVEQAPKAVDPLIIKDTAIEVTGETKNEKGSIIETKALISDSIANKSEFKITIINPACKASATDADLSKLRKKMTGAETDEERIAMAKRGFKSKCFTTEQIKNLSQLFLNDEGKYNFFDASYNHVSDIGNFKNLRSELSDDYYITRFKAMLR